MNKDKIYFIGGSPCCGKSTITEKLAKEFGFKYYKCDDNLDRYLKLGMKNGNKLMKKINKMTLDETWLRDIDEQIQEEFEFYKYAQTIILKDLKKYGNKTVILEGAVLTPEFVQGLGISEDRYICMTPTENFQVEHYRNRRWVDYYLAECSDSEKAFNNWMKRDVGYGDIVRGQAKEMGYPTIVVDGLESINQVYDQVKKIFKL